MKAKIVSEIAFHLPNQSGQLAVIITLLADANISIYGLLVGEGMGKSVIRMVVDDPEKALDLLKGHGIEQVTKNTVLQVLVPSRIGILSELTSLLAQAGINIENLYVTESTRGDTIAFVGVKDAEAAVKVFS
ncbi:MAG: ACT domain-containing protein [bacterium]|nr:ACT domain-containing protein [bacterium]